jgi:hypothetical protein
MGDPPDEAAADHAVLGLVAGVVGAVEGEIAQAVNLTLEMVGHTREPRVSSRPASTTTSSTRSSSPASSRRTRVIYAPPRKGRIVLPGTRIFCRCGRSPAWISHVRRLDATAQRAEPPRERAGTAQKGSPSSDAMCMISRSRPRIHGRSKIGDLVGVVPDDGWAAFRCRVWSWSPGGWALSAL